MSSTTFGLIFYGALFCATLGAIATTAYQYPLFPFQTNDLDWSVAWLMATVVDYYGSTLCFSGIVLASEDSWVVGILWVTGFCLLGSPLCCAWALQRLACHGSLRVEKPKPKSVEGTETQRLESQMS